MDAQQTAAILETLHKGEMKIEGQFMWGSNYTFMAEVQDGDSTLPAVYKPIKGERPLWDFPADSLAGREVAAFLVSEALSWQLVPPTILRREGPVGPGSLQYFVQHNPEYHYFSLKPADQQRLPPVAAFDALINNADRKGGHVLVDEDNHMWLIDHGVCFHAQDKLRTVIWDFAGDPLTEEICAAIESFTQKLHPGSPLTQSLQPHLNQPELDALLARAQRLLQSGRFPTPPPDVRSYPWPAI